MGIRVGAGLRVDRAETNGRNQTGAIIPLAFYHTNQAEIDADIEAEKLLYASLTGEPLARKKA